MNIMLLIVAAASFVVGQVPTGIFVLGLVTFNAVMSSEQELKARASVCQGAIPCRSRRTSRHGLGSSHTSGCRT